MENEFENLENWMDEADSESEGEDLDMQFPPNKILDRLYLGNVWNGAELAYNNPFKITAVLNVSTEPEYDHASDILYCHVPFHDAQEVPPRDFAESMAFLKYCWENGHRILVHCAAGISRSASMVVSFMYMNGLGGCTPHDVDTLLDFVKMCRPIVLPSPTVFKSCRRWLRVWPYDGSMGTCEPEGKLEKTMEAITTVKVASGVWYPKP